MKIHFSGLGDRLVFLHKKGRHWVGAFRQPGGTLSVYIGVEGLYMWELRKNGFLAILAIALLASPSLRVSAGTGHTHRKHKHGENTVNLTVIESPRATEAAVILAAKSFALPLPALNAYFTSADESALPLRVSTRAAVPARAPPRAQIHARIS